jgi:hypothetical protein
MLSPKSKQHEPPAGNWVNGHSWPQESNYESAMDYLKDQAERAEEEDRASHDNE